jgi:2-C-methyl-D-erythritol 4-phosphate cytidylyltransferase
LVIVAGGKGLRMGTTVPKQFLIVGGKPLILYTLERFVSQGVKLPIVLVLPADQISAWEKLCEAYRVDTSTVQVVTGGETRDESVKNGLNVLPESGVVGIHDGVRPIVSAQLISRAYDSAERYGSGIPAVPLKESIRLKTDEHWKHQDRALFKVIQTPQCFDLKQLKKAYAQVKSSQFTDDAGVFEAAGFPVVLVDGEYSNIKITTESDLPVLEYWLNKTS